jgi:transcriptional regulator with XRE-family HTH domain
MPPKTTKGSSDLAQAIRFRRDELDYTIEDAASRAGIGTKTWSRYESGASIRVDKVKGVCKALKWQKLPGVAESDSQILDFDKLKEHDAWSTFLMEEYGVLAAASFTIGTDILLDNLDEDLSGLSSMPRGSHIGELPASSLESYLPRQFLTRYDYDFVYSLRCIVNQLRFQAHHSSRLIAHRVVDELVFFLIVEEARYLMDETDYVKDIEGGNEECGNWDEWPNEICDDMDLVTFLYCDLDLPTDHPYHYNQWFEEQFYCDR